MQNSNYLIRFLAFTALLLAGSRSQTLAQQLEGQWWQPNGPVNAIVTDSANNKVYLGGSFSYVGPPSTERFTLLDSANCFPNASIPSPDAAVLHSVPDGSGGWYIGGQFNTVGGQPRQHLAHIQANGQLSPLFSNLAPNGDVERLAVSGSTLYAVGGFTSVQLHQPFASVTDLSAGTAVLNPSSPNGEVRTSVADGSNGWYIGGSFTSIGSKRGSLARLNASGQTVSFFDSMRIGFYNDTASAPTIQAMNLFNGQLYFGGNFSFIGRDQAFGGAVTTAGVYNSAFAGAPDGEVNAAIPDGNGGFYIGGSFQKIGGVSRPYLAQINAAGQLTSWNPGVNGTVYALALNGNTLYIGGNFSAAGGQSRYYVAALNTANGYAYPWAPKLNGAVFALAAGGGNIYFGGAFTKAEGQVRNHLAAVDAATGALVPGFNPNADNNVRTLVYSNSQNLVYAGGNFGTIGGQPRGFLAALLTSDGTATSWDPSPSSSVNALLIQGTNIYAGGEFTYLYGPGVARNYLASFSLASGNVNTGFDAGISNSGAGIRGLAASGSNIYVVGDFSSSAGGYLGNAGAFDLTTGAQTNWRANCNARLNAIAIAGSNVYIGGVFNIFAGSRRDNAASIVVANAQLSSWNPAPSGTVYAIASPSATSTNQNVIYIGGYFYGLNGAAARNNLAAVDVNTGVASNWNPQPDYQVAALAVSGNSVIVGGYFNTIGANTASRPFLASVNATNGNAAGWNPSPNTAATVLCISGNNLFVGGDFSTISANTRNRMASYTITNPASPVLVAGFAPTLDGAPLALAVSGTTLYISGYFGNINSTSRPYAGAVSTSNGAIQSWTPLPDYYGNTVSVSGSQVFIGGNYQNINSITRNYAMAIDLASGNLTGWNPDLNGSANQVAVSGSQAFLAGYFTTTGGQPRNYLASVDASSGAVSSWQPQPDGNVYALALQNNILYAGGGFNNIAGAPRSYIAAFDNLATAPSLTSFLSAGGTDNSVYALEPSGNLLYAGGNFTTLAGQPRNRIGCLNLTSGAATPWNPNADNLVLTLSATGNTVYAGGYFQNIGGAARPYGAALDASINTSNATAWTPNPDNIINHMAAYPGGVAVSGYYYYIAGMPAQNLVRLNVPSGKADATWNISLDGPVNAMALATNQGQLYAGGYFNTVNGTTARAGLLSVSTSASATLSTWAPTNNGNVYALLYRPDTVYVGGSFTNINGVARGRLAAIRASNNANISGNPNLDGTVKDLASYGSYIFATGDFTHSGANARFGLAQFNALGLGLTSWVNNLDNGGGNTIDIANNKLYVGGNFYSVGGTPRTLIASINLINNTLLDFAPAPNYYPYSLLAADDAVYVGGDFNFIGGAPRYGVASVDTVLGYAKSWDAYAGMQPAGYTVFYSLARIGSRIFTGGNFNGLRGLHRNNFAVFVQPALTPSGSNAQYCAGDTANITCNITGVFNPGNIFTAELSDSTGDFSNPTTLSTLSGTSSTLMPSVIPPGTTLGSNYKIRFTSTDPAVQGTPTSSILIKPLPAASTAVVTAGGPLAFCQGDSVQLSVPSTAGFSYQWRNATVNILSAQNNSYQAKTTGTYTVRVTNGYGCSILSSPAVSVTANPLPAPSFTPNTTQNLCSNQTATFQANTGAGLSYQWLNNNLPIPGATNSSYTTGAAGSYSVTETNANNCSATSGAVVVNSINCGPTITSLTPTNNLCQGGSVAIAFNAGGAYNAGNIFTAQLSSATGSFASPVTIGTLTSVNSGTINAQLAANQGAGTGYRIRVVSSNPATTGADNGSNISVVAQPTSAQVAITTTGALTFCQGGSVSFSVPSTAGLAYQWALGANPIAGATTNSYVATAAGTYSVTATNAAGCSRKSANKVVAVNQPPAATTTPNTPQTLCAGQTITFQANTGSGLTYQWKNNNNNIGGATNSSFVANAAGSYSVTVTNSSNCSATSASVAVTAGSCGANITDTGTLKICQGAQLAVNFTANGFNAGNVFTLQLSDIAGSFASAQSIGTLTSAVSGSITGTVPALTPTGSGYKLRIVSSNPVTTGQTSPLTLNVRGPITDTVNLCAVTVDAASGKNMLVWNKPLSANIDSFIIYKNTTSAGIYQRIGAQAYSVLSKFIDNGSDPGKMAQRYYITGKNSCGETQAGSKHRTMHLAISPGQNATTWNLIWNGYEGFPHTRYSIFRGTSAANMTLYADIEANAYNSFTDFSAPGGTVFYMVAVADGPSCNPTARTTGEFLIGSNIATNATQLPAANWIDMNIWPNPANASAQVVIQTSSADDLFTVKVLDVLGRTIEQFSATADVPVSFGEELVPGLYTIEAINSKGDKTTRRLVKQ